LGTGAPPDRSLQGTAIAQLRRNELEP